MDRRSALRAVAGLGAASATGLRAAGPREAVLATPGPGSCVSAIPQLAVRIGADRAEGVALRLKFVGGGGIAIRELHAGNAAFGVFGLSAAMHETLQGRRLVALAAVEDRAPLVLALRAALKDRVRSVADLRGRPIGVHSASLATVTNGQQFLMLMLRKAGVEPDAVRILAAGQSWETQSAALRSGLVDAVVSEEPIGGRLEQEGLAIALARLGLPDQPLGLPGEGFLRGTLITTPALVEQDPALAERMVRVVQRTLAWRQSHGAPEMVAALGLAGAEAAAFTAMLQRHPWLFSTDGRFSAAQLAETERFFHESENNTPAARALRADALVLDRWAGRKP